MTQNKIKLNKNRVLLSEFLPYEIPFIFGNKELYRKSEDLLNSFKNDKKNSIISTESFIYKVKKPNNDYRTLNIINPITQLKFIDFYDKYKKLIIYYCSKSPFSLRKPTGICKIYKKEKEDDYEENDEIDKIPNFFTYEKYNLQYKFYESYEHQQLEKKFNFFMKLDISKCFYSIYTHSIEWATKNREYSKTNLGNQKTFGSEFDKLLRSGNFNETHGIPVGGEISRIFAEIILQQVDINILTILGENKLKNEIDYTIRRYVDDYSIFFNKINDKNLILNTIKNKLLDYHLYLNESKTEEKFEKPFISNITIAKNQLNKLFDKELFNLEINNFIKKNVNTFITDIKIIVFNNNIKYSDISNYIFSIIERNIKILLNQDIYSKLKQNYLEKKDNEKLKKHLIEKIFFILDISFFVFSMDIKFTNSTKISDIILFITESIKKFGEKTLLSELEQDIINKKIRDESINVIKNKFIFEDNISSEILNFLITISLTIKDFYFFINKKELEKIFHISFSNDNKFDDKEKIESLNYFQLTTLLFFIKQASKTNIKVDTELVSLIKDIINGIITKLSNKTNWYLYTEYLLLYMDTKYFINNFIENKENKNDKEIFSKKIETMNNNFIPENIKNFIDSDIHFIDWNFNCKKLKIKCRNSLQNKYE